MDEHHHAQHVRLRVGGTLILISVHFTLAVIAGFNRLAYTVQPQYEFLAQVASNDVWFWFHLATGLFLSAALRHREWAIEASSVSAGVMGMWAFSNLAWGLAPVQSVSLAGPVLGVGMTLMARKLAIAWALDQNYESRGATWNSTRP